MYKIKYEPTGDYLEPMTFETYYASYSKENYAMFGSLSQTMQILAMINTPKEKHNIEYNSPYLNFIIEDVTSVEAVLQHLDILAFDERTKIMHHTNVALKKEWQNNINFLVEEMNSIKNWSKELVAEYNKEFVEE